MKSYLTSIGTAVPDYRTAQEDIALFMAGAAGLNEQGQKHLSLLYKASGIGYRYSVLPDFGLPYGSYTFFPNTPGLEPFPDIGARMQLYKQEALPLALKAVGACLLQVPDFRKETLTHLITVSCSGMYAPGLDIELTEKLGLDTSIHRTNINFMGCYAAFNGLKMADTICRANPEAKVLLVCIELCTIHYQKADNPDFELANALFGDGAAAVLVEAAPAPSGKYFSVEAFHCDLALEGKADMAWQIGNFGFEMILSSYIPALIKNGIEKLTSRLLQKFDLEVAAVDYFAIHPGGKKILEVIEEVLSIDRHKNAAAYEVLRTYGNMSSPTVLFVLKTLLQKMTTEEHQKNVVSFAFGPGLTLESMLLRVGVPEAGAEVLEVDNQTFVSQA
jgi:predicted naringenin-chalcone synthase